MTTRTFQIQLGTPVEEDEGISFVALASAGDPTAKTRIVFPGSPPPLNPVVYFTNPVRRLGFDNEPLSDPVSKIIQTLDSQVLQTFNRTLADVIVVERWPIGGGISMPMFFWRELRGYAKNKGQIAEGEFIEWYPENQSEKGYQVQLIIVKGGSEPIAEAMEFIPRGQGGVPGGVAGPADDLDVGLQTAGFKTTPVEVRWRLIAELP